MIDHPINHRSLPEVYYHQTAHHTTGIASWYGEPFRGKSMANGQPYNPDALTCASMAWPIGTKLHVMYDGKSVDVVVTDRGPAYLLHRLIDLSPAAFARLAPLAYGIINVWVTPAAK